MLQKYTKEQLWELYEKLSQELKEAIFSERTAENIFNICTENKIEDNQIAEVARYTGRVLMGILSMDEFQRTLEEESGLKKEVAKKITQEINRFIISPAKAILSKPHVKETPIVKTEERSKITKKDVYREPVE